MKKLKIYYSPDADDAFMMYGMAVNAIDLHDFQIELDRDDIEALNQLAKVKRLDATATSVHAYAYLHENYNLLTTASSFAGETYGPRLLSKKPIDLASEKNLKIAVPGEMTSANLAMKIFLAQNKLSHELINMPFDKISPSVADGSMDAGVVIHEGQLTHNEFGLQISLDLGKWWWTENKLPLPLGIMVVNNSFPEVEQKQIHQMIRDSIVYSLKHRTEGLKYAQSFSRGLSIETLDEYVNMYVNETTVDMGEKGRESIRLFLKQGKDLGIIKSNFNINFV